MLWQTLIFYVILLVILWLGFRKTMYWYIPLILVIGCMYFSTVRLLGEPRPSKIVIMRGATVLKFVGIYNEAMYFWVWDKGRPVSIKLPWDIELAKKMNDLIGNGALDEGRVRINKTHFGDMTLSGVDDIEVEPYQPKSGN